MSQNVNTVNTGNTENTANIENNAKKTCGCGCGCRRRVAVPITGRIYLELPYGGFGAQAAEATTGTGGGCTMCNTAVTGVNANGGGFDSYYARQYGLYPYSATNTCGCGN